MKRRLYQALVMVLAGVALAACGTSSDSAVHRSLAALATTTPKGTPPASDPKANCTNLTASLRPPASLPAPGSMPTGSFMARIQRRGYLIAGVNAGDYGFGYLNPLTGKIEGFEIGLVRELARAILGNPNAVQLRALTVNQRIPAVRNGSVDIVVDDFTITCYRRTKVDVSTVYYDDSQGVLVPGAGSHVQGLQDLGGKRVCVAAGSADIGAIKSAPSHPILRLRPQAIDCLVALQQGLVDAISTDDSILLGFHKQDPDTTIVELRPLVPVPYGMAISPAHPEFVRFVNGVMARLRADGTWRKIYSQSLGSYGPTPNPPPATYDG